MKRRSFIKNSYLAILGLTVPKFAWSKLKIIEEYKMQTTLHKANTRGVADHGWLNSHHTFSFANYHNPERMGFGVLRVINDDIVAGARGFGAHPHNNMEIISVPLKGSLRHKDNVGNEYVVKKGEIQAMSAGTGIVHSEHNNSTDSDVNFLQIWVLPKKMNIKPNYSQKEFSESSRLNKFQLIVSPDGRQNSVEINQDAFFFLVKLEKGKKLHYTKHLKDNGVYFFTLEGDIKVDGQSLTKRDGLGVENKDNLDIKSDNDSEILIMEVPMNLNGQS
ncbi:MAG: pirin family protein [Bdellovibrionales bacterium]